VLVQEKAQEEKNKKRGSPSFSTEPSLRQAQPSLSFTSFPFLLSPLGSAQSTCFLVPRIRPAAPLKGMCMSHGQWLLPSPLLLFLWRFTTQKNGTEALHLLLLFVPLQPKRTEQSPSSSSIITYPSVSFTSSLFVFLIWFRSPEVWETGPFVFPQIAMATLFLSSFIQPIIP